MQNLAMKVRLERRATQVFKARLETQALADRRVSQRTSMPRDRTVPTDLRVQQVRKVRKEQRARQALVVHRVCQCSWKTDFLAMMAHPAYREHKVHKERPVRQAPVGRKA